MKKAVLYKKLKNESVQCLACRKKCFVAAGHEGICGVRRNIGGDLYLMVYGKAVAINTDPIEKKPLYHFLPGSQIFSFGTIGCNFRCSFCQNWDISQTLNLIRGKKIDESAREKSFEEAFNEGRDLMPKEAVEYCEKNNIPSIAYTYNEPTIFSEYAHDTGVLARKIGIKNVYVSNGFESDECLEYMKDFCDAINIDIKSFSEDFYVNTCGGTLRGVLETVEKAWKMGFWIEITTLVIPGLNDSDEELRSIAKFLAGISKDIPWHVTAFHPDYKMTEKKATPPKTLESAYKIGVAAGLKYVYVGNIRGGLWNESTFCPKCGKLLVERDGMSCLSNNIKVDARRHGKCPDCGEKIAGVWGGLSPGLSRNYKVYDTTKKTGS
ncbi:MAG: AmmeMemoRadiSam system radical SAM enzyme [Candidatus Gracilibacteria bacterium]